MIRRALPPAKGRGSKVNAPLFGATFTQSLLFGPLVTNILSFYLKIVVLTYLDKDF